MRLPCPSLAAARHVERLEHDAVGLQHVLELAGVLPPAAHDVRVDVQATLDQVLDGVGDLQLAAGRRLDAPDRLEDARVEHVDADQRQVALRLLRLLDQPHDLAVGGELGDPELLRVRHPGEQDLGVAAEAPELFHELGDAAGDQVVAQVHDERRVADEGLGDHHRVRETQRRLLLDVGDAGAEARAVADRGADLPARVADDDADLADAGGDDRLDGVEEHRLVRHRHELLGGGVGERAQPGALAAGEDQPFHRRLTRWGRCGRSGRGRCRRS